MDAVAFKSFKMTDEMIGHNLFDIIRILYRKYLPKKLKSIIETWNTVTRFVWSNVHVCTNLTHDFNEFDLYLNEVCILTNLDFKRICTCALISENMRQIYEFQD